MTVVVVPSVQTGYGVRLTPSVKAGYGVTLTPTLKAGFGVTIKPEPVSYWEYWFKSSLVSNVDLPKIMLEDGTGDLLLEDL
jgi:hypothetical protein